MSQRLKPPVAQRFRPLASSTTEIAPVPKEARTRLRKLIFAINKLSVEAHAIAKMIER